MSKKDAAAKAKDMQGNTQEMHKEFQLTAPETCIQKYACTVSGFNRGTLWVSQNFLCYSSKLNDRNERLPFAKIQNIEYSSGLIAKVTVTTERKPFVFSDFNGSHSKECYTLIHYLWQNPVSYVDTALIDALEKKQQQALEDQKRQSQQGQQQQLRQRAKVDTQTADLLLQIAVETDSMQNAALAQVVAQGEQIDRIEGHLDNMSHTLKKADHLMKGIESLGYYMFGGKDKKYNQKREQALKDRSLKLPKDRPPIFEIEVLYKKQDDSLVQAILVLEEDFFKVINPENDTLIDKGTKYPYKDIIQVILRARHEHMDVRFPNGKKDPSGRLRIMSSYLQVITNQLYLRCKAQNHNPHVIFEPGVRQFNYQDERVSKMPPLARDVRGTLGQSGGGGVSSGGSQNAFVRPNSVKTADLLSESSQETRNDMARVESQLDEVHKIAMGINTKAQALNVELDRQNEQLGRIDGKVDDVTAQTRNLNKRMDKQLK